MKNLAIAIGLLLALLLAWYAGRAAGIRHAIEDAVIWTVDCYNPEDPDASAWGEYDQLIYIELDDALYLHGMYQG